jgi:hypothetical protein
MIQGWFSKEANRNLAIAVIILLCGAISVLYNALTDQVKNAELRESQCRLEILEMQREQAERLRILDQEVRRRQIEIENIMLAALKNKRK